MQKKLWFLALAVLWGARSFSETVAPDSETVEVVGQRLSIEPSATTAIDSEQLDVFKTTDLNRVMKTVPGVQIQEEDGFGLRPNIGMRGAYPERSKKINIMEDGIPSGPAPYSAPAAYYVPAMTLIDGLEITKGSSAVRYGPQTIGGSINMFTKKIPQALESTVDVAGGSYGFTKAVLSNGGHVGDFGWLLLGSDIGSDGFKRLDTGGKTGFHKKDFLGKLSYDIGDHQSVELKYLWSTEYSAETYLGISREDFDADAFQRYAGSQRDHMENEHGSMALRYNYQTAAFDQTFTLYQNIFDRRWQRFDGLSNLAIDVHALLEDPTGSNQHPYDVIRGKDDTLGADDKIRVANNHRSYYSRGADWNGLLKTDLGGDLKNELEVGLRYHTDAIRHDHTQDYYNMLDGIMVDSGIPTQTAAQDKNRANAVAAYAWDTITKGDLSLSLGMRQEWVAYHGENFNAPYDKHENKVLASMPAAGLFYRITPKFAYLLGVYKGMGLSAEDETNAGKPEESINYETGFRYTDGAANANLIGFFNDYKNIQGSCTAAEGCSTSTTDQVFNGGQAKIYGLEANLTDDYRLAPKLSVPVNLAYTYTRAYFGSDFSSHLTDWGLGLVHKGDPLPYVPEHQASLGSGVMYGKLAFDANLTIKSKSYDQAMALNRQTVPSSKYLDLALRYFIEKEWQVYATADNVTDEKTLVSYRAMGARPGKPRTYIYGIKGTF